MIDALGESSVQPLEIATQLGSDASPSVQPLEIATRLGSDVSVAILL